MVGVWFPISMFIAIGFEHSVANMFILPAGVFSGAPNQPAGLVALAGLGTRSGGEVGRLKGHRGGECRCSAGR